MEYRNIRIGEVNIPTVLDNGVVYYPVSMISTKVMLRSGKAGLINVRNKDKYDEYLHTYKIQFSKDNIQDCRFISEEGLKMLLVKTQHSRLTKEQKIGQNLLHGKLGLELLPVEYERDTNKYDLGELKLHDTYTSEIIKYYLDNFYELTFRQCAKCLNHYPLTNTFYRPDKRRPNGFVAVCVVCEGKREFFKHNDSIKEDARSSNYELYDAINHAYVERVYAAYLEKKIKKLPESFINKECFFRIVDYIDEHGYIDKYNFTYTEFINENRLRSFTKIINNIDMYTYFFGEDFYLFPWRYPKFNLSSINLTFEIYNKIFRNYVKEFNIDITTDPRNIDYPTLLHDSRIGHYIDDSLYFAVQYNNFKYAGYKFRTKAVKYYKSEDNFLFDLKYLIEKDMNIDINKVPLYLTKNVLQLKATPLYRWIVTHKNKNLYYWVDRLYPGKFIELDFDINPYRSKFDSDAESFIHNILEEELGNVIYNPNNSDHTVKVGGKVPDWFAFTDRGVIIIEYFGMYIERQKENSRVKMYMKKMDSKLEVYKNLKGYKFLFIYPEDTENDFRGLRDKINHFKNDPNFTML